MSEAARIEVTTGGMDSTFWNRVTINGVEASKEVVHVPSIEAGEEMAPELERMFKDVYRRGYSSGFANCQRTIKDAIGFG